METPLKITKKNIYADVTVENPQEPTTEGRGWTGFSVCVCEPASVYCIHYFCTKSLTLHRSLSDEFYFIVLSYSVVKRVVEDLKIDQPS